MCVCVSEREEMRRECFNTHITLLVILNSISLTIVLLCSHIINIPTVPCKVIILCKSILWLNGGTSTC